MIIRSIAIVVPLVLSFPLTSVAQNDQNEEEVRQVEAVAHGLMEADNDRDVERVVSLYAPDAVLMPPNEPPVEGITAIRPRYEEFFRTHQPALRFEIEETTVVEHMAYVRGYTKGTIHGQGETADRVIDDVFLMILNRSPEGEWRISRLMWHGATEGD